MSWNLFTFASSQLILGIAFGVTKITFGVLKILFGVIVITSGETILTYYIGCQSSVPTEYPYASQRRENLKQFKK